MSFARLPDACKRRLVDSLTGRNTLSPILRPGPTRRSLRLLFGVALFVGLYAVFAAQWPSRQSLWFAAVDVVLAATLLWLVRGARRTLSFDGTVIQAGTYLFPLDIVEARADGMLRLIPLGKVREAAVAVVASRPSLLLTFDDGKTHAFGVDTPKQAEAAFDAMEVAQKTLEKLTYDKDLEAAVHLDPFFEIRMDGSWETATRRAKGDRLIAALTLGLGAVLGLSLYGGRALVGLRTERISHERLLTLTRELEEKRARELAPPPVDVSHRADEDLKADEREGREAQRARALAAYEGRAKSPQMASLMGALITHEHDTGEGVSVFFDHTCARSSVCNDATPELLRLEQRVFRVFTTVLSETIPRIVLAFDMVKTRPSPEQGSLVITYVITGRGDTSGPNDITMVFDVKLHVTGQKESPSFVLTMPPPKAPVTALRDHSIFSTPTSPTAATWVFARGLDRLYDEVYGMFFAGAPRVPVNGSVDSRDADEKLRATFGVSPVGDHEARH